MSQSPPQDDKKSPEKINAPEFSSISKRFSFGPIYSPTKTLEK